MDAASARLDVWKRVLSYFFSCCGCEYFVDDVDEEGANEADHGMVAMNVAVGIDSHTISFS